MYMEKYFQCFLLNGVCYEERVNKRLGKGRKHGTLFPQSCGSY